MSRAAALGEAHISRQADKGDIDFRQSSQRSRKNVAIPEKVLKSINLL